jgi:hypothetical protein
MEDLEAQKKINELGKTIVTELKLDPGIDTLSKWMSHYLAEKMELAKTLQGKEKIEVDKECVEIILKIWDKRWSIPNEKSFYNDFKPLMETIKKLNPNREYPFFYHSAIQSELYNEDAENQKPQSHLNSTLIVDKIARSIIFDLLTEAVNEIELSEEREELIRKSISSIDYLDNKIIRIFRNFNETSSDEDDEETQEEIQKLENKIGDLKQFSSIRDSLLDKYQKRLDELKKK